MHVRHASPAGLKARHLSYALAGLKARHYDTDRQSRQPDADRTAFNDDEDRKARPDQPGRAARLCAVGIIAVAALACSQTPSSPTTWTQDRVIEQLVLSNLNSAVLGASGRLTRWQVPIRVHTAGIARAETALQHYEAWTNGAVRFTRVASPPAQGLSFAIGGALSPDESGSCGSVRDTVVTDEMQPLIFRWDSSRAFTGSHTIHLGSDRCNDEIRGDYPSSVAEHQLAHALGLIEHFDGFDGHSGLDDARLVSVIYNLYANPVGATREQLVLWK